MKHVKASMKRIISLFLVLSMVISMMPVHAHAAEASLSVNKETFEEGEGILVTATSDVAGDWVGIYPKGGSNYLYWFYTDGKTHNIFSTNDVTGSDNKGLPAGEYEIVLDSTKEKVYVTITNVEEDVDKTTKIVPTKSTFEVGEEITFTANSYKDGAWIGLYERNSSDSYGEGSMTYWYVHGRNGCVESFGSRQVGEYALVLFADSGYTIDKITYVTVEEPKTAILSTDKEEYALGEPILVDSTYYKTSTDWIALYKKGETPGGPTSLFYYYISVEGQTGVNLIGKNPQRDSEFTPGEYSVILLANDSYSVVDSVDIKIGPAVVSNSKTFDANCDNAGYILETYTDGSTKEIPIEGSTPLGHDYGTWTYLEETKEHTAVCSRDKDHVKTEACEFDEGVVTKEPTEDEEGIRTFTCGTCNGTYTEIIPKNRKEVGREEVPATCDEDGKIIITYDDGTTSETVVPKLGHTYGGWVFDPELKAHRKVCVNDETHTILTGCTPDAGTVTSSGITYTCTVCKGQWTESIFALDKTEYNYGEPIMVNVVSKTSDKDWVGLYKKGETFNPDAGGVKSIFWAYVGEVSNPFDLLKTRDENFRGQDYKPGEYTVSYFKDDSYTSIATIDITIKPVEKSREEILPTCEKDGYILITYTHGATATEPSGKTATGHEWGPWSYVEEEHTHIHVCKNDAAHKEEAKCTFDEGVVTKEPTEESDGIKTFTCTECGGTYEEIISAKEIAREEVVKAATCDADGVLRVYYTDGSFTDKVIYKLGHDYGDWIFDKDAKIHKKVCVNDKEHTVSEKCKGEATGSDSNGTSYKCTVCGGEWTLRLLETDKTVYNYGEPIFVTSNYMESPTDWVGIYKKGETYNPQAGGAYSIFWDYVSKYGPSVPFDILKSRDENGRGGEYVPGAYTVALFAQDSYEVLVSVDITVEPVVQSEVEVDPTCEEDGYILVTYTHGATEKKPSGKTATGHAWGEWTYNSDRTHSKVCKNDAKHVETANCSFDDGVVTKEPTGTELGEKTFTCEECGGTYIEKFSNATIVSETVVKQPACEENGLKKILYSDGKEVEVELPKLGHNYPAEWTFNSETKHHEKACANDKNHVISEPCTFDKGVISGSKITYTCSVCKSSYSESVLTVNKTKFEIGEEILVTANCLNEGSWVGLYKKGESANPNAGGIVSMYWYYVTNSADGIKRSGQTINLLDEAFYNIDRSERLANGEYEVRLFGDGNYDKIIASVDIIVESDLSENTYEIALNGENIPDGTHLEFEEGVELELTTKVTGYVGTSWLGLYTQRYGKENDFKSTPSSYWYYVADYNGTKIPLSDEFTLEPGDYTLAVFADGGYSNVQTLITFTITRPTENEKVIIEPTCTSYGVKQVTYEDGTTAYVPIDPLGHSYGEWKHDDGKDTHSRVCTRDKRHVDTEKCTYKDGICTVCGGGEKPVELVSTERIAPTCDTDGKIVKTYSDGSVITVTAAEDPSLKAYGHDYDMTIETKAVGNKAGLKKYTCIACKNTYTEVYYEAAAAGTFNRYYGAHRYETAMKAADALKANLGVKQFGTIVLASGKNYADALSGSYLANKNNAPILLIDDIVMKDMVAYVKANLAAVGKIYILGGVNAVSANVEKALSGYNVKRLGGANRYDTNLLILKEAGVGSNDLLVCTGRNYADSLSVAAVNKPILLVDGALTKAQTDFLKTLKKNRMYLIGGKSAVNNNVEKALTAYGTIERIAGNNRFDTSVKVAMKFFPKSKCAVLVYGANFPDGLSGGALAYSMAAPILLVADKLEGDAVSYAKSAGVTTGVVLGGKGLISDQTATRVFTQK